VVFRQFVDDDLGCACYLVGDEQSGEAVVVDPPLAVDAVVAECERRKLRLARVLETHTHADHVSGHGRLALERGVPISIHPAAEPGYPADALADGDRIELGDVVLTVLHTPGHRPEHCCLTITDRSRADEPWLVLTGDSLFVGDAARPDLAVEPRRGAEGLFDSLHRLLELPDGVEVYPGHVAGSLCGANMSSKASSTIGFERRFNGMLGLGTLDEFIAASTGSAGLKPPNVERVVALNRGPFVGAPPPLGPVGATGGATVLDVRDARRFAAGHVPGALNVPLSSSAFGTRCGFVLAPDERVVVHADSPQEAELAAQRLHAVGFLELDGRLDDPDTPARIEPVELDELEHLVAEDAVHVLDVREADERDGGYIAGSRNVSYRLVRALGAGVDGGRPVVTICESGTRAAIAASILSAAGVDVRPVLDGGIGEWMARGNRTIEFRRCGA
jgi:glyoxylase-like metal-dependent hydrolase (beta-lactamase superfamily II)/rhodanese-related sulfurtransferase